MKKMVGPIFTILFLMSCLNFASAETPALAPEVQPVPESAAVPIVEKAASEFAGTWKLGDSEGATFFAVLNPDGTSLSDWGPGEVGKWEEKEGSVTVSWTDGWHDVIAKKDEGYEKSGFAPGVALTDKPTNNTQAEKLSEPVSDLIGTWQTQTEAPGTIALTYRPDQTFGVDLGADGTEDITGIYRLEGERIQFKDVSGKLDAKCRSVSGVYNYTLGADGLRYTQVEDSCPERTVALQKTWTKE